MVSPNFSSTFLISDLETESKPASVSVWIMHTFVLLSLIFSIVVHKVNMAFGIEKDFLYLYCVVSAIFEISIT